MLCLKQFKLVGSLEAIDFKELGSLILRTKGLTTGWDEFLSSVLYEGPSSVHLNHQQKPLSFQYEQNRESGCKGLAEIAALSRRA
jgi:hypothetical protein